MHSARAAVAAAAPRILNPTEGQRFFVAGGRSARLRLEARRAGRVFWFVDGRAVAGEWLDLVPGRHEVVCFDAAGRSDRVCIDVATLQSAAR